MAPPRTLFDVLTGSPGSAALYVGSGGAEFTREALLRLIVQFAETLRSSGIQPGDVVTIADPNTVRGVARVGPVARVGLGLGLQPRRTASPHPLNCLPASIPRWSLWWPSWGRPWRVQLPPRSTKTTRR